MHWLKIFHRFFDNINIRTKFLVAFFLAVLVPVIILGIYFINRMSKITTDYTVNNFHMEVDRLERNLSGVLRTAKDLADRFYIDNELQGILIHHFTSLLEMTETIKSYTEFDYYTRIHQEIAAVRIYTTNPAIRENRRFMEVTPEIIRSAWYRQAVATRGLSSWSIFFDSFHNDFRLRLARLMPVFEGGLINVLTVDLNIQALTLLLNKEKFITLLLLEEPSTDNTRLITAGGNDLQLPVDVSDFLAGLKKNYAAEGEFVSVKKQSSYRVFRQMGKDDVQASFYLVSFFSVSQLKEIKGKMFLLGLILILICLAVSISLILILTHYSLIQRIRFLSTEMRKIVAGDLKLSLKLEGRDEIGELSRDIDTMIGNLKLMISKVYRADLQKQQFEIKQKQMEFKLLASQLNPHFFFNALEAIRAKALSRQFNELNTIVKALGKLMRFSLDIQHHPVPVAAEVEFVLNYLGIQKYRFDEKLQYKIELTEDVSRLKVIPYILQPIVENAIVHGVERKIGACRIMIKIEKNNGLIVFTVQDDGDGIDQSQWESILQALGANQKGDDSTLGIGLMNVQQRIRLYYGDPYGINIESKKNQGTKVVITLPCIGE